MKYDAFPQYKLDATRAAKELCYGEDVVRKIKKAESMCQIQNIMMDARHAANERDYKRNSSYNGN